MNVSQFLGHLSQEEIYGEIYYDLAAVERLIRITESGLTISANGLLITLYAKENMFPLFPYDFYAQKLDDKDDATTFPSENWLSPQYEKLANFCCCSLDAHNPTIKRETLLRYFQMVRETCTAHYNRYDDSDACRLLLRFIEF